MKLVQRILSRGLLILAAILAAVGYHFRAELFPQWFGSEARQASVDPAPADAPVQTTADIPPPPATPNDEPPFDPSAQSAAAPSVNTAPAYEPEASLQQFGQPAGPQTEARDSLPSAYPPAYAPPAAETPDTAVSVDTGAVNSDPLGAARAAYWAQDPAEAERLYRQAADADPTNSDALGELGNLYYAQGRWEDTAIAYAGTIERLNAAGDVVRAEHLLRVLDGLDPTRAQSLRAARQSPAEIGAH